MIITYFLRSASHDQLGLHFEGRRHGNLSRWGGREEREGASWDGGRPGDTAPLLIPHTVSYWLHTISAELDQRTGQGDRWMHREDSGNAPDVSLSQSQGKRWEKVGEPVIAHLWGRQVWM